MDTDQHGCREASWSAVALHRFVHFENEDENEDEEDGCLVRCLPLFIPHLLNPRRQTLTRQCLRLIWIADLINPLAKALGARSRFIGVDPGVPG
jgi:hypothetical protein